MSDGAVSGLKGLEKRMVPTSTISGRPTSERVQEDQRLSRHSLDDVP